jgi:NADPH:quinone reductase-like Zn-dependent oxidoreductase
LPGEPPEPSGILLIYGGSTATGILGIQFAKRSGFSVVVTCSHNSFDYVKSFGAMELSTTGPRLQQLILKPSHMVKCIMHETALEVLIARNSALKL